MDLERTPEHKPWLQNVPLGWDKGQAGSRKP